MNNSLLAVAILLLGVFCSGVALAAHHEEGEKASDNYVLMSTYEIAHGQNPADLEKELVELQKQQEADGFNNCGLYRHQYGGKRAFYGYCFFSDYDQFDAIQKKSQSNAPMATIQNYGSHADNLLHVQKRNLKAAPDNIVSMTWRFGPYLTVNERQERADLLFDAFNRAFSGCNLYFHAWGPEMAHYISCGFKDFSDFGKKDAAINEILAKELADAKLDIKDHSDDLLVKVMD